MAASHRRNCLKQNVFARISVLFVRGPEPPVFRAALQADDHHAGLCAGRDEPPPLPAAQRHQQVRAAADPGEREEGDPVLIGVKVSGWRGSSSTKVYRVKGRGDDSARPTGRTCVVLCVLAQEGDPVHQGPTAAVGGSSIGSLPCERKG